VLGLGVELAVSIGIPDFCLMFMASGPAVNVTRKRLGVGDPDLATHVLNNALRDVRGVGYEGPEEPESCQLNRKAEAVVVTAAFCYKRTVSIVEVKVAT
jgi:hypothetical protein